MVEIFIGAVVDSVVVCFSSFMVVSDVKEFSSETFSSFAYSALVEKYSTVYRGTVETKKANSQFVFLYVRCSTLQFRCFDDKNATKQQTTP